MYEPRQRLHDRQDVAGHQGNGLHPARYRRLRIHSDLLDSLRARIDLPIRVDSNVQALALDQSWRDGYDGNELSILVGRSMCIAPCHIQACRL